MVNQAYSEAIAETLDILKHTRKEDVEKISPKFMEYLNKNTSKTYKPNLDHTKKIKDMNLKTKTKAILAIIYRKFWCTDEQLKAFNKTTKQNEVIYQNELREKYNPDNIFKDKKNNNIERSNDITENLSMIEFKESIFTRIKNWFKRTF